nr:hypothetical protein [Tanacetum cinerariifolium]
MGKWVAFCLGLRFALEALRFVSEDLAFCLQKILCFVFRRSRVLSSKILRFVSEDLAFCLQKILCFVFRRSRVLSSKILRFASEALRFVYFQDLAFCLRNTAPNGDVLRKCILSGPYKPTIVLVQAVAATNNSPAIPEHTPEMWEATERLQQGESLNIQDAKTNLFWEFGKFTSHNGETMESYYTRFYKLMNEMIRNNLIVATMQVRVQFLQQLQLEWSRTVNIAGARENVGSSIVQQSRIQCFNYKEFRHFAKECRKPKRVKDSAYHKEKILMCKQAEQGVPLQAEHYDWLADTDEEIDKKELEAHYSYMANI